MLGAFKDFGKPAIDLQKKEFYDAKATKKATIKTKSADGVSFEAFATAENKSEVNLNFKDKELELKNKIDQAGTYTIDATVFKVADGIDLKACFVTPDATGKQAFFKTLTLGCDYKTADLNATGNLKIGFADDAAFGLKTFEFSKAVAMKVSSDMNAGLSVAGMQKASGDKDGVHIPAIVAGCTFNSGDMKMACNLNGSFKSNEDYGFQAGKLTALLSQQATKETAIAASFAFGKGAVKGDRAGWVDGDAAVGVEIKLGSAYKLSDCATVKSKLTINAKAPVVDFAWVQKFGNGSLTLSNQFAETHAFGVSYTLDA